MFNKKNGFLGFMHVSNIKDIYFLKTNTGFFNKITIDTRQLKYQGVLRHAIVYALNRLSTGGILEVIDEPFRTFSISKSNIDFWQVKLETFRVLKDRVEILEADKKTGHIVLRKRQEKELFPKGFSFGIVFGGPDEALLKTAVDSILANPFLQSVPYEIIIGGPSAVDARQLLGLWQNHPQIRYLEADIADTPRVMICQKKNKLFEACRFSLVTISHTRISFPQDYAEKLWNTIVEMATPKVVLAQNGEKYLDFFLFHNYNDFIRTGKSHILGLQNIDDDYLYYMTNRVPGIDGGINIFNKNIVPAAPYNEYVAWGEAEDVELAATLFQHGILIDYLPDITCFSQTNKINIRFKALKKPFRMLYKYLWLKKGR
jgi:hypothetical protein